MTFLAMFNYDEFKWWINFALTLVLSVATIIIAWRLGMTQIKEQKKANEIAERASEIKSPSGLQSFYTNIFSNSDEVEKKHEVDVIKGFDIIVKKIADIGTKISTKNRKNQNKMNTMKFIKNNKK